MFNPAELKIINRHGSGFLGIRRNQNGDMVFVLPLGFDDFPIDDPALVNNLFFDLYKTFRCFSQSRLKYKDIIRSDKDGSIISKGGFSFTDKDEDVVTIYSKISMIEEILTNYDELKIFRVIDQDRKSEQINYQRLDKYLHEAIYHEDDTFHIDDVILPKPVFHYSTSDIVRMYCFIFVALKKVLREDFNFQSEVKAEADIFKAQHLHSDSELFDVRSHSDTIEQLKQILDEVHRQVTWKSADYWDFYNVIEIFLYGDLISDQGDIHWGISKFSPVWEDICTSWIFSNSRNEILYADSIRYSNTKVDGFRIYVDNKFENNFYLELDGYRRYCRPDLIYQPQSKTDEKFIKLFDIKPILNPSYGTGYRVRLKQRDEKGKEWFRRLSNELFVNGQRKPSAIDYVHTFNLVSPEKYQTAIANIKAKMGNEKTPDLMLVDFKYTHLSTYTTEHLNSKAQSDIRKQSIYEAIIKLNSKTTGIKSQFCIPKFYNNKTDAAAEEAAEEVDHSLLHNELVRRDIEIVEVNFMKVLHNYISLESDSL